MATYPLVNDIAHDYSCVEIDLGGVIYTGITAISYSQKLEPGAVMGTSAQKLARTRGSHSADGSMTMNLQDAEEFITALGEGYMETSFNITVTFSDGVNSPHVHRLFGCRITDDAFSHAQGSDPTQNELTLDIMRIERNGLSPLASMMK
jgi:hypothetical protein